MLGIIGQHEQGVVHPVVRRYRHVNDGTHRGVNQAHLAPGNTAVRGAGEGALRAAGDGKGLAAGVKAGRNEDMGAGLSGGVPDAGSPAKSTIGADVDLGASRGAGKQAGVGGIAGDPKAGNINVGVAGGQASAQIGGRQAVGNEVYPVDIAAAAAGVYGDEQRAAFGECLIVIGEGDRC